MKTILREYQLRNILKFKQPLNRSALNRLTSKQLEAIEKVAKSIFPNLKLRNPRRQKEIIFKHLSNDEILLDP